MRKTYIILLFLGLFYCGYEGLEEYNKLFPTNYELIFFDVDLGDASLIKTPNHKTILIDTSADDKVLNNLSSNLSFFDKTIDLLILSHGDSDHIGGASAILNHFQVSEVWLNGANKKSPIFAEFINTLNTKNISYRILEQNQDFQIDKQIILDTVYPFNNISNLKDHGNNESIVFLLSIFEHKILFTGDIENSIENQLLLSGEEFKADILKVAHHGSKNSSSLEFLMAVNPKWAVIQADTNNQFGHPHKIIVDRLNEHNIKVLQTGLIGDIKFKITSAEILEM